MTDLTPAQLQLVDEYGRTSEYPCAGDIWPGCNVRDSMAWAGVARREYVRLLGYTHVMSNEELYELDAIRTLVENLSFSNNVGLGQGRKNVDQAIRAAQLCRRLLARVHPRTEDPRPKKEIEPWQDEETGDWQFPPIPDVSWPDVDVSLPDLPEIKAPDMDHLLKMLLLIAAGYGLFVLGAPLKAKRKRKSRLGGMLW